MKNEISKLKELRDKKHKALSDLKHCKEDIDKYKASLEKLVQQEEHFKEYSEKYNSKISSQNAMIQSSEKFLDLVGLKFDVLEWDSEDNVTGTFSLSFTKINPSVVYTITFHHSPTKIKSKTLEFLFLFLYISFPSTHSKPGKFEPKYG